MSEKINSFGVRVKIEELRTKGKAELEKSIQDLKKKLSDFRFRFSSNKLKNVKEIEGTKKDIARMMTIINEKNNKVDK